nr:uncharacterized protein si:ch211-196c10.15 [Nothobranchius furzeri]
MGILQIQYFARALAAMGLGPLEFVDPWAIAQLPIWLIRPCPEVNSGLKVVMLKNIKEWCHQCERCTLAKSPLSSESGTYGTCTGIKTKPSIGNRLYSLPEEEGENVRSKFIEICQNMDPGHRDKFPEVLDSIHRIGRQRESSSAPLHRAIILQFTIRHFRDIIWKAAKRSDYLKTRKLHFKEDLSPEDRERRNQLWPQVEKARKEGKIAYFVGARAFVNRKEIH